MVNCIELALKVPPPINTVTLRIALKNVDYLIQQLDVARDAAALMSSQK